MSASVLISMIGAFIFFLFIIVDEEIPNWKKCVIPIGLFILCVISSISTDMETKQNVVDSIGQKESKITTVYTIEDGDTVDVEYKLVDIKR